MDETYFELGYFDERYFNTIARANANMTAFDIIQMSFKVIHLMEKLTYMIREETRIYNIRQETRQRNIAAETRTYNIKEG